jgi:LysM repeat protein
MRTKHSLLWIGLTLVLVLTGCGGGEQPDQDPPAAAETAPPIATPIVTFQLPPTATPEGPALPPSLYLEPSVLNLTLGGSGTVNVWADSVQSLHGLRLELTFDPDYAQVNDADAATAGIQVAPGQLPEPATVAHNEVTVGEVGTIVYEVSQEANTGADGSGIVATISLSGVAEGGTPLRFESVSAVDPEGNALEIMPLSDGLITVMTGEAPAEPTSVPAPPAAPAATQPPAAPTAAPAEPVTGGGVYYVVQAGENLFRIGLDFGTSAAAIAAASNIADASQVAAGTMVLIPVAPPHGSSGYYVQRHDTLYSIARRFGATVDELAALNGMAPDQPLEVGQILAVVP